MLHSSLHTSAYSSLSRSAYPGSNNSQSQTYCVIPHTRTYPHIILQNNFLLHVTPCYAKPHMYVCMPLTCRLSCSVRPWHGIHSLFIPQLGNVSLELSSSPAKRMITPVLHLCLLLCIWLHMCRSACRNRWFSCNSFACACLHLVGQSDQRPCHHLTCHS